MPRVMHFEIHAEDVARALAFYKAAFGWTPVQEMPGLGYYLISTGEGAGIDGAIMKRMGAPPSDGQPVNCYTCIIGVDDIDAAGAAAVAAGATVAMPKMQVGEHGWSAYYKDTEGNIFGLWQEAARA